MTSSCNVCCGQVGVNIHGNASTAYAFAEPNPNTIHKRAPSSDGRYFPFTEPSFELEIMYDGRWMEVCHSTWDGGTP